MFWFDKEHPNVTYMDIRKESAGFIPEQPLFTIAPDVVADFTNMPFLDSSFKMVVFDPPHAKIGLTGILGKKYGTLPTDWESMLKDGFSECWRVLEDFGVLIFKWNSKTLPLSRISHTFPSNPLFGHTTAKSGSTIWVTFMKIPTL
jgi:hypothetical protein